MDQQNTYYPPQGSYPHVQPEPIKKKKPILKWIFGAIAALVLLLIVAVACSGSDSNNNADSSVAPDANSDNQEVAPGQSSDPNAPLAVGQTFTTKDGLAVTVSGFTSQSTDFSGQFTCANVDLANTGDKQKDFSGYWDWKIQNPAGVISNMDFSGIEGELESGSLAPGGNVSGIVCSENTEPGTYRVIYDPTLSFSNETAQWDVAI